MNETDAIACLETGAEELAVLIGSKPNHRGTDTHALMQTWLNKTIGAGLDSEAALEFLATRLAFALEERLEVTGYSVAEPMGQVLMAFSTLKRRGFWCGINSVTMTSALAEVPDGVAYAVMHAQDIEDLEDDGTCCIAFGTTDQNGDPLGKDKVAEVGHAVVEALEAHGLSVEWNGDPARRIRIQGQPDNPEEGS